MEPDPRPDRPPTRWLWTAAAGLATTLAGLGWDAAMHARDHDLASQEGVFTLTNPSHVLFVGGLALTALGVACALVTTFGRPRMLRLRVAAGALALTMLAGGLGAWASGSGESHTHDAAADMELDEGPMIHEHGSDKGDAGSATAKQRAAAQKLLDDTIEGTTEYRDPAAAEDAGYRFGMVELEEKLIYHIPNPPYRHDGHVLDPDRPESLLYARHPEDDSLVLVGVVYRMEEPGVPGLAIGGPITVWHNHSHCMDPATHDEVSKPTGGSCPGGTVLRTGADMMHVWFTGDVATAFNGQRPPVGDLIAYLQTLGKD